MKKAFTMIELIFVVVILGIISAIAVPKLSASRDDALVAKVAGDIKTLMNDVLTHYAVNAELINKEQMRQITNVPLIYWVNANRYKVNDFICLSIGMYENKTCSDGKHDVALVLDMGYDPKNKDSIICEKALKKVSSLVGYSKYGAKKYSHISEANGGSWLPMPYDTPLKSICIDLD